MTIMVHAGYLVEKEQSVEGGAAELFFQHRDEIIEERKDSEPIYLDIPHGDEIRDKSYYPTFHDNWVGGILRTCLLILNLKPGVRGYKKNFFQVPSAVAKNTSLPGPLYDPWYVYEESNSPTMPLTQPVQLKDANSIKNYFILPGSTLESDGEKTLNLDLKVQPAPPEVRTAFDAIITALIRANPPSIEPIIPDVPSEAFPDLNYEEELSLPEKQKKLAESVVSSFKDLMAEVEADPDTYLVPIGLLSIEAVPGSTKSPGPGLLPIFNKAKEILEKNFGKYAQVEDPGIAISNILNYEALKRTLIKPLYLSVIGSMIGSHPKGFVAGMSILTPDAVGTLNADKRFEANVKPIALDYVERQNAQVKEKKGKINPTDPPIETPAERTPSTGAEVVESLTKAWYSLFNVKPAYHSIQIIFAQCVTENGYNVNEGKFIAMYNYNIGNVKYVDKPKPPNTNLGQLWHRRAGVFEFLDPNNPKQKTVLSSDNPGSWFRSFETLDEGCEFHLRKLNTVFQGAWPYVISGDAAGFAQALKNAKYYTAEVSDYTAGVKTGMAVCNNAGGQNAYDSAASNLA